LQSCMRMAGVGFIFQEAPKPETARAFSNRDVGLIKTYKTKNMVIKLPIIQANFSITRFYKDMAAMPKFMRSSSRWSH
jgi:hypothetical protein